MSENIKRKEEQRMQQMEAENDALGLIPTPPSLHKERDTIKIFQNLLVANNGIEHSIMEP